MQKKEFEKELACFVSGLKKSIVSEDGQWLIKGFVDLYQNVYSISTDTKIVSKILEIHLFPEFLRFAKDIDFKIVLPEHQNHYPDISLVCTKDETIKYAIDLKTTYRDLENPDWCNGFTLGSHGEYFKNRTSLKNITYPYNSYNGHYCIGIIYDRVESKQIHYKISELHQIVSVIKNLQFFVHEKWKLASDRSGSGNTANIGSIDYIPHILAGKGMFSLLGEKWFDDFWMNYRNITELQADGTTRTISSLEDFVKYRKGNTAFILKRQTKRKK